MATTSTAGTRMNAGAPNQWMLGIRTLLRGAGQVMFQCSSWTGLFFLIGIFWGAYSCHTPEVAWGAAVGLAASTLAGYLVKLPYANGDDGLWGFNGILVGCAFPTFMANNWLMWLCLIFFAMCTTWVRSGFNNLLRQFNTNSFTFPFVFLTWMMLFGTRIFDGLDPTSLSHPSLPEVAGGTLDTGIGNLAVYWLKGISQVFLINDWITGILFLVGLWLSSRWAAIWAAAGSAIALAMAILLKAAPGDIANGLFGFSPVLTAIALGCTFYKVNWKSAIWAVCGIVATVFIQGAMDVIFTPWGLPTLTGPFCVATWLFVLPAYKFSAKDAVDRSEWTKDARREAQLIDNELDKIVEK